MLIVKALKYARLALLAMFQTRGRKTVLFVGQAITAMAKIATRATMAFMLMNLHLFAKNVLRAHLAVILVHSEFASALTASPDNTMTAQA